MRAGSARKGMCTALTAIPSVAWMRRYRVRSRAAAGSSRACRVRIETASAPSTLSKFSVALAVNRARSPPTRMPSSHARAYSEA